jgi:predicted DNA-binding transcriptional regulator YafY
MPGPSSRVLSLLSLLQARRDWPGDVLAARLEVSPRTVRRDVDRLRGLGYRIQAVKGPDGGYRLEAGAELPPLLFDDEQAVAVALALQVAPASGADLAEAAARALATVRQVMPSRLRHRMDAIEVEAAPGAVRVDPAVLAAVSEAVTARRIIRFDHAAAPGAEAVGGDGVPPARRVEPHGIVARRGRWHLVAWDLDRDAWRTFRIDRMTPRVPLGAAFVPRDVPGGDASAFVAARARGADGTTAWPCIGRVVLALPLRDVAPFVDDDAVATALPDGRTALTLGAWSWPALAATVARFDAGFEVVDPPALRDAVRMLGERLVAMGGAVPRS